MIDPQLKDRVALVSCANHGIGAATAIALAEQGARAYLTYLRQPQRSEPKTSKPGRALHREQQAKSADWVVEKIRGTGGEAEAFEIDLSDARAPKILFDQAEERFGRVDILVNNAAYSEGDTLLPATELEGPNLAGHPPVTFSAELFDRHAEVNTLAVGLMMVEFARPHIATGRDWGRIINISTDAARSFPTEVSYGATKYATESLSRSAALEFAPYGITVNVVAPGSIQTGYIAPASEPEVVGSIPMGRLGTPEDVADVIVFLSSEQGRWLTGQVLYVGGGKSLPTHLIGEAQIDRSSHLLSISRSSVRCSYGRRCSASLSATAFVERERTTPPSLMHISGRSI